MFNLFNKTNQLTTIKKVLYKTLRTINKSFITLNKTCGALRNRQQQHLIPPRDAKERYDAEHNPDTFLIRVIKLNRTINNALTLLLQFLVSITEHFDVCVSEEKLNEPYRLH